MSLRVPQALITYADLDSRIDVLEASSTSTTSSLALKADKASLWINVKDAPYSATGDGSTDDTTAIQAAIDAATTAGGGTVYFPRGTYQTATGIVLKARVVLSSAHANMHGTNWATNGSSPVMIRCPTAGVWTIDTPGGADTYGVGVTGIDVRGSNTGKGGIRFQRVKYGLIQGVGATGYLDQGIQLDSTCLGCRLEHITTFDCIQTTARAAIIGAVDVDGTDHWITHIEASSYPGATSGPIDSTNFYITGFLLRGTSCYAAGVIGETSDYGIRVSGNENRLVGCRGDTNWAGDWIVAGDRNTLTGCHGKLSARAANNTYDSFIVSGKPNILTGCMVSNAGTGRTYRYGFNETGGGALITQRNRYEGGCAALNCATAVFKPWFASETGGFGVSQIPMHPADTTVLPDVTGTELLVLDNYATVTTVNGFINGAAAQQLVVIATTANVTLAHNARAGLDGNILLNTAANKTLSTNRAYHFQRHNSQWYEIA